MTLNTPKHYCPGCRRRHERSSDSSSTGTPPSTCSTGSTATSCPQLDPPGPDESQYFYYGLPSCPRLIGRASSIDKKWKTREQQRDEYEREDSGYFAYDKTFLYSVGQHGIVQKWDGIEDQMLKNVAGLPWNAMDVFRIGNGQKKPVVVWVALDHDATPWDAIRRSLLACKQTLNNAGLNDVDVQFRLAIISDLGLIPPRKGRDFSWRLHRHTQPLSTGVGLSISNSDLPALSGSVGVYLRPAKDDTSKTAETTAKGKEEETGETGDGPVWALICRHVVLPTKADPTNQDYRCGKTDEGKDDCKEIAMTFGKQELVEAAIAAAQEEIQYQDEQHATQTEAERGSASPSRSYQVLTETAAQVQEIQQPEARHFGHIVCAPSISVPSDDLCDLNWMRDWGLVKVDSRHRPANVADVRSRLRLDSLRHFEPYGIEGCTFVPPPDGLLPLAGLLSIRDMFHPPHRDRNNDMMEGYVVGKHGAKTGMTWGVASEIRSVTRSCLPRGQELITHEWAIAVLPGLGNSGMSVFSSKGDSGSVVFTVDGRVAAFITRGSDAHSGADVDVTYATPAEFVFADVSRTLGQEVCLL